MRHRQVAAGGISPATRVVVLRSALPELLLHVDMRTHDGVEPPLSGMRDRPLSDLLGAPKEGLASPLEELGEVETLIQSLN